MIKRFLKIIGLILLIILLAILAFFWHDANFAKYSISIDEDAIPHFKQIDFPFSHIYNSKKSLPIAPSAIIDIDNDGLEEVFMGGGLSQEDKLLKYEKNGFRDISAEVGLSKKGEYSSISSVAVDFDNNGFIDLLIAREDGLHIYYNTKGEFTETKINTSINEKSTPSGITVGDIDKDGDLDIFLSTYIKKDLMQGQTIFEDTTYGSTSALLLNVGENHFKNITVGAGLNYIHNTFMAILVDIDNDGNLDLIVAHDTGEIRTYKNNGKLYFKRIDNPSSNKFAYPMGIAAGDYNNDGKIDFMFSNTGSTLPRFLAKGDIKDAKRFNEKWILFRNDGNFRFTDVASESKIADYEFSWGAVFADMNNDGLQDLIVAENYVDLLPNKFFRLPGRLLIQKEDHSFVSTESKSGVVNPNFGISPLVSDFNNDGYLDLILTNINSGSLAYINHEKNNNYLQVHLIKNAKNIGARIEIKSTNKTLTDWVLTGEGLASDQTATLQFGLGKDSSDVSLSVFYIDGETKTILNIPVNNKIEL